MDLFVINRYEGDDPKPPQEPYDHLAELLKKIELRKQQRSNNLKAQVSNDEPPKKKKKRNKATGSTTSDAKSIGPDSSSPPEPPKTTEKLPKDDKPPPPKDFMILGVTPRRKKSQVRRVLPEWLSHPEIISSDLSTGPKVKSLRDKLDDKLIDKLKSSGMKRLFPVQSSMIEWMGKCSQDRKNGFWTRHTCVSAPTGSGKTLAYVLPIVEELKNRFLPRVRCLVVLPVQELAAQVFKVMMTYASVVGLKVGLISGARDFEAEQKILVKETLRRELVSRVDIVVATPGRLVDHIQKTKGFSLDYLQFLVIDEADRATEWLTYIPDPHRYPPALTIRNMKACKIPPAQKLLFSATLSQDPEKLSRLGLFQPILFTTAVITDRDDDVDLDKETGEFVGRYTSPSELIERAVECPPEYKPVGLVKLITTQMPIEKTLVFTNSGESVHRLALLVRFMLEDKNVVVDELSAKMFPKQKEEMLNKFSNGETQILVCSDMLARGMDIPGVKLVVSYDLPKTIEGYIHRAGRTGRAGLPGTAISILTSNQIRVFTQMFNSTHKALPSIDKIEEIESIAVDMNYQGNLDRVREFIENEEKIKKIQPINNKKNKRKRLYKHSSL